MLGRWPGVLEKKRVAIAMKQVNLVLTRRVLVCDINLWHITQPVVPLDLQLVGAADC